MKCVHFLFEKNVSFFTQQSLFLLMYVKKFPAKHKKIHLFITKGIYTDIIRKLPFCYTQGINCKWMYMTS